MSQPNGAGFYARQDNLTTSKVTFMIIILATLLLIVTILLLGGTILSVLQRACSQPSRVNEIRRMRQEGLAVNQEGEAA